MCSRNTNGSRGTPESFSMLCRRCGEEIGASAGRCPSCQATVPSPSPEAVAMLPLQRTDAPIVIGNAPAESTEAKPMSGIGPDDAETMMRPGMRRDTRAEATGAGDLTGLATGREDETISPGGRRGDASDGRARRSRRTVRHPLPHHPSAGRPAGWAWSIRRGTRSSGDGRAQGDPAGGHERSATRAGDRAPLQARAAAGPRSHATTTSSASTISARSTASSTSRCSYVEGRDLATILARERR